MARRTLPRFDVLSRTYPTELQPCEQGREREWNQCAIRLSLTLEGAGFALKAYTEPTCRHGHARGAESLATYLWRHVGPPKRSWTALEARAKIVGRQGIVFFKDIDGFRGGRGDHIDLWDGRETRTGEYFVRAKEVWFWPVS